MGMLTDHSSTESHVWVSPLLGGPARVLVEADGAALEPAKDRWNPCGTLRERRLRFPAMAACSGSLVSDASGTGENGIGVAGRASRR
jgi:hypothetical protein